MTPKLRGNQGSVIEATEVLNLAPTNTLCKHQLHWHQRVTVLMVGYLLHWLAGADPAEAAWTHSTPGAGGAFLSAAIKGDTAYVGGDLSGVYFTANAGVSWTPRGTATAVHVSALAIKPGSAATVLLGTDATAAEVTNSPIWYSADAGVTWSRPLQNQTGYITYIAWGPTTIWAAGATSVTGGTPVLWAGSNPTSWFLVTTNLPAGTRPVKLLTHPVKDSVLYLLSADDGFFTPDTSRLYKSSNSGSSWSRIAAGDNAIGDIAINPTNGQQLFMTTGVSSGSVRMSNDAGNTWTTIHSTHTGAILVKAAGDTVRVVNIDKPSRLESPSTPPCNECGTWDYAIAGGTWSHRNDLADSEVGWTRNAWFAYGRNARGRAKTIWRDQSKPDTLWWVTPQFVWRSTNGGWSFKNVFTNGSGTEFATRGIENICPRTLDVSGTPWVGYYDLGLWKRLSNENWVMMNDSTSTSCQTGELWDGHGGNVGTVLTDNWTVWVANGSTRDHMVLKRSTDSGNSWSAVSGLPSCTSLITGLSLDRNSSSGNRTMYVTADGYPYKSTNDGQSWTKLEPGPYRVYVTGVDRKNGNIVYAGGRSGIWYSTNGGSTWTQNTTLADNGGCDTTDIAAWCFNGAHSIAVHPNNQGTAYATFYWDKTDSLNGAGGLYKTTDNGASWNQITHAAGPLRSYVQAVALDEQHPETLYVGRSSLTHNSRRPSRVGGGLWVSNNGAANNGGWSKPALGLPNHCVLAVAVTGVGDVWIGVPGLGYYHSPYPGGGGGGGKDLGPDPGRNAPAYFTPQSAPSGVLFDLAGRRVEGQPRPGIYFTKGAQGRRVIVVLRDEPKADNRATESDRK